MRDTWESFTVLLNRGDDASDDAWQKLCGDRMQRVIGQDEVGMLAEASLDEIGQAVADRKDLRKYLTRDTDSDMLRSVLFGSVNELFAGVQVRTFVMPDDLDTRALLAKSYRELAARAVEAAAILEQGVQP